MELREIQLSDREWIEPLLAMGDNQGSEYTFSNNFVYRKIYHIKVGRMKACFVVRSGKDPNLQSYL